MPDVAPVGLVVWVALPCKVGGDQRPLVRPLVGSLTMLVDRLARGLEGFQSASQLRAHHAGQHITGARSGQSGVAGGVDDRRLPGRGNDRARAFEHDSAVKALRQLLGCAQAVVLHLHGGGAQQAGGLQRMGCEHRGRQALGPGEQQGLE